MSYVEIVAPEALNKCTINLPPSKSVANRMLIMAALGDVQPQAVLHRPLSELCDDISALALLIQTASENCKQERTSDSKQSTSDSKQSTSDSKQTDSKQSPSVVDIGAAGTAMRFGTAFLSVTRGNYIITGTERIRQRPIGLLVEALRSLGADIEYVGEDGFPPLHIVGNTNLRGGQLTLKGNVSSQFISALLMIAPTLKGGLTLTLEGDIVSRPYIDLTLALMKQFGAKACWMDERAIHIEPSELTPPADLAIEADWTAASYWYEIEALCNTSNIKFREQLNHHSMQGDKVCDDIFNKIKSHTASNGSDAEQTLITSEQTTHDSADALQSVFCYDFTRCPDLAQTIVVTCCMLDVPFRFTGLQTLRIKETDRIEALSTELAKLGYVLQTAESTICWDGSRCTPQPNPIIDTYHDHRMAMAFAPCALKLKHICIADPDVVTKSYPTYWHDLRAAGIICRK